MTVTLTSAGAGTTVELIAQRIEALGGMVTNISGSGPNGSVTASVPLVAAQQLQADADNFKQYTMTGLTPTTPTPGPTVPSGLDPAQFARYTQLRARIAQLTAAGEPVPPTDQAELDQYIGILLGPERMSRYTQIQARNAQLQAAGEPISPQDQAELAGYEAILAGAPAPPTTTPSPPPSTEPSTVSLEGDMVTRPSSSSIESLFPATFGGQESGTAPGPAPVSKPPVSSAYQGNVALSVVPDGGTTIKLVADRIGTLGGTVRDIDYDSGTVYGDVTPEVAQQLQTEADAWKQYTFKPNSTWSSQDEPWGVLAGYR